MPKKSKYTEAERRAIVQEWRAAASERGVSASEVAARIATRCGVAVATLYAWNSAMYGTKRYHRAASGSPAADVIATLENQIAAQAALIERLKAALRVARPFIPPGTPLG